ncbi:hypothetical protein EYF80_058824 [Liparis tanakae]|uniref:Uncharacterized protein n=1 Tax=Liparis tanakae TaxID=230148 RepID=A0A4Z2EQE4_9TELE|nr:hypothetical protein EYF80_058824 [Liparis tanakae]
MEEEEEEEEEEDVFPDSFLMGKGRFAAGGGFNLSVQEGGGVKTLDLVAMCQKRSAVRYRPLRPREHVPQVELREPLPAVAGSGTDALLMQSRTAVSSASPDTTDVRRRAPARFSRHEPTSRKMRRMESSDSSSGCSSSCTSELS